MTWSATGSETVNVHAADEPRLILRESWSRRMTSVTEFSGESARARRDAAGSSAIFSMSEAYSL